MTSDQKLRKRKCQWKRRWEYYSEALQKGQFTYWCYRCGGFHRKSFPLSAKSERATARVLCGECGGTGEIVNDGPFSQCDDCKGTGLARAGIALTDTPESSF